MDPMEEAAAATADPMEAAAVVADPMAAAVVGGPLVAEMVGGPLVVVETLSTFTTITDLKNDLNCTQNQKPYISYLNCFYSIQPQFYDDGLACTHLNVLK